MIGKSIAANLVNLRARVEKARESTMRQQSVELVAVSKFHSCDKITEAISAGQNVFAENYVQEALQKITQINSRNISWHFIGNIQKNKIKHLVGPFSLIQSVAEFSVAKKISEHAKAIQIRQKILLQVNIGVETSKGGIILSDVKNLFMECQNLEGIKVTGLMCLPPLECDDQQKRQFFRQMRESFELISKIADNDFVTLSMGTSHDFELAIAEGSNMVRVGTDIFGERPKE